MRTFCNYRKIRDGGPLFKLQGIKVFNLDNANVKKEIIISSNVLICLHFDATNVSRVVIS